MEDDSASDSGTGWKALAELQYENRHYPQAYETGAGAGRVGRGVGLACDVGVHDAGAEGR